MKLLNITALFFLALSLASCDKEDELTLEEIPGLGGDTWTPGAIDNWIMENLTRPYNIAVKYKWDQFELELNRTLVPPKEEKVIPVMNSIKTAWIEPYVAEAGATFLKTFTPKFFSLVGSYSFNADGTVTEGTAEGGRKVVLYNLNNFRIKGMPGFVPADSFTIKRMFHVIHHEFGHILHQNVLYPEDYKRITIGQYTAGWYNFSDNAARGEGFITSYSMNNTDDDFVEMIAVMLTEGREGFNRIVNSITGTGFNGTPAAVAQSRLRQKEDMVVTYFKQVWNIDFYSLQNRTRTAIDGFIK